MTTAPTDMCASPLVDVIAHLRASLERGEPDVSISVVDPALGTGRFAGATLQTASGPAIRRPYRTWVDLADRLALRLVIGPVADERVVLTFTRLAERGWEDVHTCVGRDEKYGVEGGYTRVRKVEDPGFVIDLGDALDRADRAAARDSAPPRVLDVGVNTADELVLLASLRPHWDPTLWHGLDHSSSALARARARVPGAQFTRVDLDDADALDALQLGEFDLVLAIATLHGPHLDGQGLLRRIVQRHMSPRASIVVGTPNCRYVDGELLHGAKMLNFRQPDLSVLLKTVGFTKRYLNQHGFKVFVTGKHTILVTGVPERAP